LADSKSIRDAAVMLGFDILSVPKSGWNSLAESGESSELKELAPSI